MHQPVAMTDSNAPSSFFSFPFFSQSSPLPPCIKGSGLASLAAGGGLLVHNVYIMKHNSLTAFQRSLGGLAVVFIGTYGACLYGKAQERQKVIDTMERAGVKREVRQSLTGEGSSVVGGKK